MKEALILAHVPRIFRLQASRYLCLLLTEHLNYTMVAKHVSKSASRALGLVISKFKAFEHFYKTVQCSSVEYDQLWSCEKGGQEILMYKCHTK